MIDNSGGKGFKELISIIQITAKNTVGFTGAFAVLKSAVKQTHFHT
jgi:hypothetical protein